MFISKVIGIGILIERQDTTVTPGLLNGVVVDAEKQIAENTNSNWLIGIFVIVFIFLMILFTIKLTTKIKERKRKTAPEWDIIFDDVSRIKEASVLFRKLKILLHPDRFVEHPEKMVVAQKLFQKLEENKHSLSALQMIEMEAEENNITK